MIYKMCADLIVVVHFIWILFMIIGFMLTLYGFWWRKFFDMWLLRSIHLLGIVCVAVLGLLRMYCPLTVWENLLREQYDPTSTYPGSFIVYYIEKLVYPAVNPLLIQISTILITGITILVFIIRPPEKIRNIFKKAIKKVTIQKNNTL